MTHTIGGRGSVRAAARDVTLPFGDVTRRGSGGASPYPSLALPEPRPTRAASRHEFEDENDLVAIKPPIRHQRNSLYTNAPLQEDPQPAVHPKQWFFTAIGRPASCAGSRSQRKSGFPLFHCIPSC